MLTALPFLICLGAATIGGVFFAFSTFVMKALAQLPANQGIAVMQRINAVVLNPFFLGIFVGTGILAAIGAATGFFPWSSPRSVWLLAAGGCYVIGSFGVTVVCNVPRNERLARRAGESAEAVAYWPVYVREWLRWNHVRTAASLVSAACAGAALVY